jgi:hypothetical protein
VHITTLLYELQANVVPNWFGVGIANETSSPVTDFSRPTLYFHPSPQPAGYQHGPGNSIYFGKSKDAASRTPQESKWLELFAYVDRLVTQLAGAVQMGATPNQIVIVPFMPTSAIGDCGILPAHWLPTLNDILTDVRAAITGTLAPLTVSELVVAGYSFGYEWSTTFRALAKPAELNPLLKQIWDFDGFSKPVSNALKTVPGKYVAVKYSEGPDAQALLLPKPRWSDYPDPPPVEEPLLPAPGDVHHLIRDFMFLDAALKR